ncbi:hypothetical protein JTB14_026894 [Gonioctena quinquepunctata]|nr:hypothetical protein JTB14_026894 [Gonioctena quinquepunctata]
MDYGSILCGSASEHTLQKLYKIQNQASRLCLGAMESTPMGALRVEALVSPLSFRRIYLVEKLISKIKFPEVEILKKISKLNTNDLQNEYWLMKKSSPLCMGYRNTGTMQPKRHKSILELE